MAIDLYGPFYDSSGKPKEINTKPVYSGQEKNKISFDKTTKPVLQSDSKTRSGGIQATSGTNTNNVNNVTSINPGVSDRPLLGVSGSSQTSIPRQTATQSPQIQAQSISSSPQTQTAQTDNYANPYANISVNKVGENLYSQRVDGIDWLARYDDKTGKIQIQQAGGTWYDAPENLSFNYGGHTFQNTQSGLLDTPYRIAPEELNRPFIDAPQINVPSSRLAPGSLNYQSIAPYQSEIPKEALVQNQLANITRQDSPLMDLAKQEGIRTAANRGLLNSSIAAGASQAELVRQATPIAQQDAATYAQQTLANQTEANKANIAQLSNYLNQDYSSFENELTKNLNKFNTGLQLGAEKDLTRYNAEIEKDLRAYTSDLDLNNQKVMANIQLGIDRNLAKLGGDIQGGLIKLEIGSKNVMDIVKQESGIWAQFLNSVGAINQSDMNVKDKVNQIQNLEGYTINAINNVFDKYNFLDEQKLQSGDLINEINKDQQLTNGDQNLSDLNDSINQAPRPAPAFPQGDVANKDPRDYTAADLAELRRQNLGG